MRVAWFVVRWVLKVAWVSLMVLTPLFGFWIASSLAAFQNASTWVALLVGLLLFPIVPLGWDAVYVWRRSRKDKADKPILTRLDRWVLRTLIVNGLFLGVTLWRAPDTAFRALAVRGDWMLDGYDGAFASEARSVLLGIADKLAHRSKDTKDDFGTSDKPPEDVTGDDTTPAPVTPTDGDTPAPPRDPRAWPMPVEADVLVRDMPVSAQTSPEAVGAYLAGKITDKRMLAKALHDYVVLRLTYDDATAHLEGPDRATQPLGKRPPQDAASVFAAKTGVCEGYARLYSALAKAAGLEVAYVTGYIRDTQRNVREGAGDAEIQATLEGYAHAWNAVKLDGKWYLVDTTWDDPDDKPDSTYFLTPPQAFRLDHLPDEAAWQLTSPLLTTGDFVRQPLMSPRASALGLSLVAPVRSQVTVHGSLEVTLANPQGARVLAQVRRDGHDRDCTVAPGADHTTHVACELADGSYELQMFAQSRGSTSSRYEYVGSLLVNSR
jgi:transglutaminase-like putative cysteine protease